MFKMIKKKHFSLAVLATWDPKIVQYMNDSINLVKKPFKKNILGGNPLHLIASCKCS